MAAEEYLGFLAKAIFLILVVIVIVILAQQVSSGVSEKAGGLANWFQQCILCSIWNFLAEFFSQWWARPFAGGSYILGFLEGWLKCAGFAPDKPLIYIKDLNLTISDDDDSKNKLAKEVADCIIECAKKARCPDVICCVFTGINFTTDYEDFECRVTHYLYNRGYCNKKVGIFSNFSNNDCGGNSSCMTGFSCSNCGSENNIIFTGIFADGVQTSEKGYHCIYVFLNRWGSGDIKEAIGNVGLTKEIKVGDEEQLWRVSCQSSARKMAIYCKK